MVRILFNYFIFPGFLFLSVVGMLVSWVDRKVTARIQWRVGPPLLQPFYDLRKLCCKEIVLPQGSNTLLFVLSPILAVASVVLIADILIQTWLNPSSGFVGDLIVVVYLFMMMPIATILGAAASHNPLASLGAGREMKLVLSYELPLILALLVAVVKTRSILLGNMIAAQTNAGPVAASLSGFIALCVAVVCLHSKLGIAPFDIGEAETELSAGSLIEYSGPLLALWKLGKMILFVAGPLFLIIVFWGGGSPWFIGPKYIALIVVAIVLRNTNPRVRIDQAMRFFWGPVALASIAALGLALAGW